MNANGPAIKRGYVPAFLQKSGKQLTFIVRLSLSDFIFVLLMKSVSVSWQNGVLSRCIQTWSLRFCRLFDNYQK